MRSDSNAGARELWLQRLWISILLSDESDRKASRETEGTREREEAEKKKISPILFSTL